MEIVYYFGLDFFFIKLLLTPTDGSTERMALAFEPAAKHNSNFEHVPEIENKNLKKKTLAK
jgi:hypothetical protein